MTRTPVLTPPSERLFSIGALVCTLGAVDYDDKVLSACLARHCAGDWGDEMTPHDKKANDKAVKTGDRILSSYELPNGTLWIITEGEGYDRVTTFLLPDELLTHAPRNPPGLPSVAPRYAHPTGRSGLDMDNTRVLCARVGGCQRR